jgi:xanthine dehydrogenase accessory factor
MRERCGIADVCAFTEPVVRVTVASVEGSAPREAGAAMLVFPPFSKHTTRDKASPESPLPMGEGQRSTSCEADAAMFIARPPSMHDACEPESPLPWGEGGVRGYDLSIGQDPSPGAARHPLPMGEGQIPLRNLDGIVGTIGGGQLEFEAIAHARALLAQAEREPPWLRDVRNWPLGPSLGQCCGGAVRVLFEYYGAAEREAIRQAEAATGASCLIVRSAMSGEPLRILSTRQEARDLPLHVARVASDMLSGTRSRSAVFIPARKGEAAWFIEPSRAEPKPLFIYGAGHVGRAIVKIAAELDFAIHWVDIHQDRFPAELPEGVTPIVAQAPSGIAAAAPQGAYHLVLTYSHALDLAICHALLAEPRFGFLGLIGSASKRARFHKRLAEAGIAPAALQRLTCPIGIGSLRGKEPATIAVAVAAQLIEQLEAERGAISHKGGEAWNEPANICLSWTG